MRQTLPLLFASLAVTLSASAAGCGGSDRDVTGVAVEPGVSARITQSNEARIEGNVETKVRGGVLHVMPSQNGDYLVPAVIFWPEVTEIYTRGHAEVVYEGIDASRVEIDARGTSRVVVTGTSEELAVLTGGDAEIDASGLRAVDVWLDGDGNSWTVAFADSSAAVTLQGDATAVILGNPIDTQEDVSGSATLSYE